jgi:radical SAM protein with 4Fe4S-binding SPASM domain
MVKIYNDAIEWRENMYFKLNNKVYIVKGAVNHNIYDFNTGILYNINNDTYGLISKLITNEQVDKDYGTEEETIISSLLQKNLIISSDSKGELNTIDELKRDTGITFAWIEVTQRCNLICVQCYEESTNAKLPTMSFEDFKIASDSLVSLGVKSIQFIGGEPLIKGDLLKEMIKYCGNSFDSIEVFTNGTYIDENWIDFFKKYKIKIALSVYSYDEEQHDKVTRKAGSNAKTDQAIRMLKNNDIQYRVCRVEIDGIELGERTEKHLYNLSKRSDLARLTGRAKLSLYNKGMLLRKIITKETFENPIKLETVKRLISGHNCFSSRLYIDAQLNMYPCVMERRFCHGNLKNKVKLALDENLLNLNKDSINECSSCEYRYLCFDCRPDSLGRDRDAKPWYCTYLPLEGKWQDKEQFINGLLG